MTVHIRISLWMCLERPFLDFGISKFETFSFIWLHRCWWRPPWWRVMLGTIWRCWNAWKLYRKSLYFTRGRKFDLPLYNIYHIKLSFYNPNQWESWRILVNQKESNRPKISTLTVIINQTYQDKSNPQFSVLKPIAAMDQFCSSPRLFRVLFINVVEQIISRRINPIYRRNKKLSWG